MIQYYLRINILLTVPLHIQGPRNLAVYYLVDRTQPALNLGLESAYLNYARETRLVFASLLGSTPPQSLSSTNYGG